MRVRFNTPSVNDILLVVLFLFVFFNLNLFNYFNPGFSGSACEVPTLPSYRCPRNCTGQGKCVGQVCACHHGFTGSGLFAFLRKVRFTKEAIPYFLFFSLDCSKELFCRHNCSGHGLCIDGECVCKPGFGQDPATPHEANDCSKVVSTYSFSLP
jgi:hypothetical protein